METIHIITREDIESALCESEPDAFDVHWDYSGRGMYGSRCFGVVPRSHGWSSTYSATALLYRAWAAAYQRLNDRDPDVCDTAEFLEEVEREERRDNMGYDSIHYWPCLEIEGPDDDEEDDDGEG